MAYSLENKKENLVIFVLLQAFVFVYVLIMLLLNHSEVSDYKLSLYYVILSIGSLILSWVLSERKLNLFFLYLVCFHLFIGFCLLIVYGLFMCCPIGHRCFVHIFSIPLWHK